VNALPPGRVLLGDPCDYDLRTDVGSDDVCVCLKAFNERSAHCPKADHADSDGSYIHDVAHEK
jgi:hypothetical protein